MSPGMHQWCCCDGTTDGLFISGYPVYPCDFTLDGQPPTFRYGGKMDEYSAGGPSLIDVQESNGKYGTFYYTSNGFLADLKYLERNGEYGTPWTTKWLGLPNSHLAGYSFGYDPDGIAQVTYDDYGAGIGCDVFYASLVNGAWVKENIDINDTLPQGLQPYPSSFSTRTYTWSYFPALAFRNDGVPVIAFWHLWNPEGTYLQSRYLYIAQKISGSWVFEQVFNYSDGASAYEDCDIDQPQVAIAPDRTIHITYVLSDYPGVGDSLWVLMHDWRGTDNVWHHEELEKWTEGGGGWEYSRGGLPRLAVDSQNHVHIAYGIEYGKKVVVGSTETYYIQLKMKHYASGVGIETVWDSGEMINHGNANGTGLMRHIDINLVKDKPVVIYPRWTGSSQLQDAYPAISKKTSVGWEHFTKNPDTGGVGYAMVIPGSRKVNQ